MKTSMIIPCIPEDFRLLDRLFAFIYGSTVLPDEIILVLNQYKILPQVEIEDIKNRYKDRLTVICIEERNWPGVNRQIGSNYATGDILIYQDADDVPHKLRVEIIKRYFETYDILHLNHSYLYNSYDFGIEIDKSAIKHITSKELYNIYFPDGDIQSCLEVTLSYGLNLGFEFPLIHAGATAVKKELLSTVRWKDVPELSLMKGTEMVHRTEDLEFCMEALFYLNKSMIIDAPLYFYFKK